MNERICWLVIALWTMGKVEGQSATAIPSLVEKNGRHALVVDGKPYFVLGGQAHNSSAWPAQLPHVWSAVAKLHANTLEIPIYWEQVEAEEGKYDFSLVDTLLVQARAHGVRLVLLWFATWKNGSNHYLPAWMKRQPDKYPNIVGISGQPVDSPSPVAEATLDADRQAFGRVMKHLKIADRQHTVIMVQVENESGAWGSVRDYSAAAEKLFGGPVPESLLQPELLKALGHPGVNGGSWRQVFANDADEYFQAWTVARFVGQVAAEGKKAYPLPLYVNAALRDPLTHPSATTYESGGPTDNVLPIWKVAAPAVDILAPDIYLTGQERILKVIDLYDRADNPLFVPELGLQPDKAKYLYAVLAQGGIGFSPFGIDENGGEKSPTAERLEPFAQEYSLLLPMMPQLAKWGFEGRIRDAVEPEDHAEQTVDLGNWKCTIHFGMGRGNAPQQNSQPLGAAMIIQVSDDQFLLTGTLCRAVFQTAGKNAGKAWQYLKVEEGRFEHGAFTFLRIWNGDETDWGGPQLGAAPVLLRVTLITR